MLYFTLKGKISSLKQTNEELHIAAYTVIWTIDVEVDGDHKDAAQFVADSYFQARIASGEQDSACSFVVVDETDQHQVDIDLADSLSDLDGDDTE